MFGDEGLSFTSGSVFCGFIEVAFWDGSILKRRRREERVGVAVLLDKTLGDNPEDLSPDFTDGVDSPVTWLVQGLVR